MTEPLDVYVAADNAYVRLLAPMVMSVLEHTRNRIAFHVLADDAPSQVMEALHGLVSRYAGATISFHDALGDRPDLGNCARGWFRTDVVFARLLIAERFPSVDRCLYLDVDTLALGDVGGIADMGTGSHGIAAVPDHGLRYYVNQNRHRHLLELPPDHVYFNNGVMLIDCGWWRREQAARQILEIARARRHLVRFPTQDPMNIFFSPNGYQRLPPAYNRMPFAGSPPQDAVVLHFTGEKPWEDPWLPSAALFRGYADRSPFAEEIRALASKGPLRRTLRRTLRSAKRAWHAWGNRLDLARDGH